MSVPSWEQGIDLLPRDLTREYRAFAGDSHHEDRLARVAGLCARWFESQGSPAPPAHVREMLDEWVAEGAPEPGLRNRPRCGSHDGCSEDLTVAEDGSMRCEACDITFGPSWAIDASRRQQLNLDGPDGPEPEPAGFRSALRRRA